MTIRALAAVTNGDSNNLAWMDWIRGPGKDHFDTFPSLRLLFSPVQLQGCG
jgi:hypothetical protein